VILSADGMSKEPFYVAASRGRRAVTVITSDRETLRAWVGRSAARKSASELARRPKRGCRRGEQRGLAAARDLARQVTRYVKSLPQMLRRDSRLERGHEHGFTR
jgi:hypothetical protein